MANKEHVKIIKQGAKIWNNWRKDNPDIRPDLKNAILTGLKLIGVDLKGVDLTGAYINSADLDGADISGADLTGVVIRPSAGIIVASKITESEGHRKERAKFSRAARFNKSKSTIEFNLPQNINPKELSEFIGAINTLHSYLSGQPLEIESIKIGLPDHIHDSSETWKSDA